MTLKRAFHLLKPADLVPQIDIVAMEAAAFDALTDAVDPPKPPLPEPQEFERADKLLYGALDRIEYRLTILDEEIRIRMIEQKETMKRRDALKQAVERIKPATATA